MSAAAAKGEAPAPSLLNVVDDMGHAVPHAKAVKLAILGMDHDSGNFVGSHEALWQSDARQSSRNLTSSAKGRAPARKDTRPPRGSMVAPR